MKQQLNLITNTEESGATFSPCRTYRYRLWRKLSDDAGAACWIMLNPSTADEVKLDPTVRRCIGFTRAWGLGRLEVVNLFALRSTDPRALYHNAAPIGPDNDQAILEAAAAAQVVVVAWGTHGRHRDRGLEVARLLEHVKLVCLGTTGKKQPLHPLYIRGDTKPVPWLL